MGSSNREDLLLEQVVSEFDKSTEIPLEKIQVWIRSENIEVLGAVYSLITDAEKHYLRIKPYLSREDYFAFIMHYLERCIRENPAGDWADSRYAAGRSVVNWFIHFWNDPDAPRSMLTELKDWLAKLYKEGDEELRTSIITAILEHLFEHEEIEKYFKNWLADSVLRPAHEEASGYATELRKEK